MTDAELRKLLQTGDEPEADAFTARVMASLPPQPARHTAPWFALGQFSHWSAISAAACAFAALYDTTGQASDSAQQLAAYALLVLLCFWSIPSRWSRF
jgi:hypothetical protein